MSPVWSQQCRQDHFQTAALQEQMVLTIIQGQSSKATDELLQLLQAQTERDGTASTHICKISLFFFTLTSCASFAQLVSIMETENQPDFNNTSSPPQPVLHSVPASCKNRNPALFSLRQKTCSTCDWWNFKSYKATGFFFKKSQKGAGQLSSFCAAQLGLVSNRPMSRASLKKVTREQHDVRTCQKNGGNRSEQEVIEEWKMSWSLGPNFIEVCQTITRFCSGCCSSSSSSYTYSFLSFSSQSWRGRIVAADGLYCRCE